MNFLYHLEHVCKYTETFSAEVNFQYLNRINIVYVFAAIFQSNCNIQCISLAIKAICIRNYLKPQSQFQLLSFIWTSITKAFRDNPGLPALKGFSKSRNSPLFFMTRLKFCKWTLSNNPRGTLVKLLFSIVKCRNGVLMPCNVNQIYKPSNLLKKIKIQSTENV